MENHVGRDGGSAKNSITKGLTKKLRFVMVVTLAVLLSAVLLAGCGNKPDAETDKNTSTDSQGIPSFEGEMSMPKTITIEKIGIKDVEITPVGLDENNFMHTPEGADGVTWYQDYASPGWDCNAILTGHNYFNEVVGTFARLHELEENDEVIFKYDDGSVGYFRVYSKERYPDNDTPESTMLNEGATRTTLITCDGERKPEGGYPYRIILLLEATKHLDKDGNPMVIEEDEGTEVGPAEEGADEGTEEGAEE